MHIDKKYLHDGTMQKNIKKRDEQEAIWLMRLSLPAGLRLPKQVQKRGRRWLFTDSQERLWSLVFDPPEQTGLFSQAQFREQQALRVGFSSLPDRYYGEIDAQNTQSTDRKISWILQREGGKNPLRCWLPQSSVEEQQQLGDAVGRAVRAFQQIAATSFSNDKRTDTWRTDFQTDIDYLLYRHGMVGNKTRREYVLIDFISEARHWLNVLPERAVIGSVTIDRLHGLQNGFALDDWSLVRPGDGVYDLIFLNDVAEFSPVFCRSFLTGYSGGVTSGSTYRLLSFYTAVTTLKRLVDVAEGTVRYQDMAHATQRFEEIVDSFHDFSSVIPDWARKN